MKMLRKCSKCYVYERISNIKMNFKTYNKFKHFSKPNPWTLSKMKKKISIKAMAKSKSLELNILLFKYYFCQWLCSCFIGRTFKKRNPTSKQCYTLPFCFLQCYTLPFCFLGLKAALNRRTFFKTQLKAH